MKHKYHTIPLVSFAQVECFYQPALFHWVPLIDLSFYPGGVFSPTSHLFYILSRSLFVMIKIAAVYLFLWHTLMYQQLETDRLLIRPIATTDSKFILELVNTPGWLQFIGDRNISNTDDAEKYIQKIIDNQNFFYSVFELKETQQPIGLVTFLYRDNLEFPDIGFALLPQFEKNGYTFEAAGKYLNELVQHKVSPTITGITDPENEKSIKLLKRLGLTFQRNFMQLNKELSLYAINIQ
jgi:RimJ/RimL family protein N-acetyltransferase